MPDVEGKPSEVELAAMRERARRLRETPVTITLTRDEWQTALAGLYRALLADAREVSAIDRGEPTDPEMDMDPLMLMGAMVETYNVREKLHELMHEGSDDLASWSPGEVDDDAGH